MGSEAHNTKHKLQERIDYLEENRRFIQNSLEMVLSLSDFHKHLTKENDRNLLLHEGLERFKKIIPMAGGAIYLVDDDTAEFSMALCQPETLSDLVSQQVEFMIEEGLFAWAIRERRGVFIASDDHAHRFLVHAIANHSRIQGMFVGLLQDGKISVPDTSLSLLSITLLNLANVMESIRLYQWVKNQNILLEKKVEERTLKLNRSGQKLKQAMVNLKKMAREADQANKAKSQFLANMSHEIRTPLNGIIGCGELALKSDELAGCHELARISLGESEHLLHLINNVLDYSKIEAGKIEMEHKPFDLIDMLRTLIAGLRIQARAKGLDLDLKIIGELQFPVVGDALRLRQVLMNLVNNAIKFTHEGSVTVMLELPPAADPSSRTLKFAVIDTGIGIAADRQDAIFKRFTQADESTTRRYGGTGLGTTIAHQLVSLMGGELTVESAVNQGTRFGFTIRLPLERTRLEGRGPRIDGLNGRTDNPEPAGCARILLAEDTPVNQLVIRKHLEARGHSVVIADNGLLAVEACRSQRFDLVLMDIQMPEMDGLEATRLIRSGVPAADQLPIIALTANTDPQTRTACKQAGMQTVLTKPIRREALLMAVDNQLSRASLCASKNGAAADDAGLASPDDRGEADSTIPPLDLKTAEYEFGEREMVRQVVEQLIQTGTAQLNDIRLAMEHHDLNIIRQRAHALKGGAATAEAKPLSRAAAELEAICAAGGPDAVIGPTFARLDSAFNEFTSFIGTIDWS